MTVSTSAIGSLETRTRSSDIVAKLRHHIVTGVLPAGERITESGLAEQLGVSRQPLREAIRELVQAQLLVQEPYRSLRVRTFTQTELLDLFAFRISLEQFAFSQLWSRRTDADLEELHRRHKFLNDTCDSGDEQLAIEAEINLHSWCFELADNSHLSFCWRHLIPLLGYYHHLCHKAHPGIGPRDGIHDDYVAHACGDDLPKMLETVSAHIGEGRESILQRLAGALPE